MSLRLLFDKFLFYGTANFNCRYARWIFGRKRLNIGTTRYGNGQDACRPQLPSDRQKMMICHLF
jgi:hypothetical protein